MENKDFIPEIQNIEERALDFVVWLKQYHKGKSRAIMARNMKQWGRTDREVRKLVHYLRLNEHPIGSCNKGYYYAQTQGEIADTLNFIINSQKLEAYNGLKKSMSKIV